MGTQYRAERFVKQMGCGMVSFRQFSVLFIDLQGYGISCLEHAFSHVTDMAYLTALKLNCIFYCKLGILCGDYSHVGLLSAHGGIKRSFLHNDCTGLSVSQSFYNLCFRCKNRDLGFFRQFTVTVKFSGDCRIDRLVYSDICAHIVCCLSGRSCLLLLFFHCGGKTVLIQGEIFLLQNLSCQINREAVGVVELECVIAGKNRLIVLCHLSLHISQDGKSLIDSLIEFIFFLGKHFKNHGTLLFQFRITVF